MKILVAEDDPISAKVLERILGERGFEIISFPDGKAAFEYFQSDPTPVVISDWMMPEMDGLALCRAIRDLNLREYTHFIMLTARTGHEHYRQAMSAGVDDFLVKPVNKEEMLIKLRVTKRIVEQRHEAERTIRALARFPEDNPNPVLQVDCHSRIVYANRACLPLLDAWQRNVGETLPRALQGLLAANEGDFQLKEAELACGDQVYSFAVTSVYNGDTTYLYGHNITDRKRAENELVQLKNQAVDASLHDQLTGLPNRMLLRDRLEQDMARCRRHGRKMALVMVDIDNFKTINDSQGHKVGDEVLQLVAQCLKDTLRQSDTVCRWGGDELMLLVADLQDRANVPAVCEKTTNELRRLLEKASISLPVTLSMGYSLFPDDADDANLLMQQADHAMYVAKAEGRNCWREFKGFTAGIATKHKAELHLRLIDAVERHQIQVHYQPIIDAATDRVAGMEALARWQDDSGPWISPDVFIPIAEEKGLIAPLGRQVVVMALERLLHCRRQGALLTMSLNLSKAQLLDPSFHPWLAGMVWGLGLEAEWITLEVTERQSLLNHEMSRQRLEELAAAGFRLSLDDFGTGYASLDMVSEMPFHELKIPRGLICKVETTRGARIVQAIADMARTMGMTLVAEGIETEPMLATVRRIGIHKLQGYLLSKPLPPEKVNEFLDARGERDLKTRRAA